MNTTTVAVDLAKDVLQLAAADSQWRVTQTARLNRSQFAAWFENRAVERVIAGQPTSDGAGVKLHMGRGRLMDRHTIEVGERTITSEKILIATGGHPVIPDIPGKEFAITSNEAFHLPDPLAKRITIVGAGYIAVEFAGIFNGLGSQVDLVLRRDRVLRGFD